MGRQFFLHAAAEGCTLSPVSGGARRARGFVTDNTVCGIGSGIGTLLPPGVADPVGPSLQFLRRWIPMRSRLLSLAAAGTFMGLLLVGATPSSASTVTPGLGTLTPFTGGDPGE